MEMCFLKSLLETLTHYMNIGLKNTKYGYPYLILKSPFGTNSHHIGIYPAYILGEVVPQLKDEI